MKSRDDDPAAVRPLDPINVVKYSLPELLAELRQERTSGVLAMEKLQQVDIGNLFKKKQRHRRGKSGE